jgi:hypothetical protein
MVNHFLITFEILLVVVFPLIILYRRGGWPLRATTPCLISIPILWYPTYAPIHELSHIAGTYLVGGTVVDYRLIPRFWLGEVGHAWIKSEGITESWQQLITLFSPYILDAVCIAAGMLVLRRSFFKNPFVIGFVFMLLCLRPAFDFVCESIAFLGGDRGDFYAIQGIIGSTVTWLFIILSLALSLISVVIILRRFVGFPEASTIQAKTP